MVLKSFGHRVDCASNAKEALDILRDREFDVLLVDIRLPDVDGIQLLHRVPASVPRPRSIVITGYPTLENAIGAVNEGADGYLLKPFEVRELLDKIHALLEERLAQKNYDEKTIATYVKSRVKESVPVITS
jgi:YesN/AraC family two-component response regulator